MAKDWMILLQQQNQLSKMIEANQTTKQYGLMLSEQDAKLILKSQRYALKQEERIEFGEGVIPKIIYEFCDSDFIDHNNYVDTIIRLQEIFYLYKNEMLDEITDEELIHFMREQFEEAWFGDLSYLEGTCLRIFSEAIRAGYQGHRKSGGYGNFDEVKRWDYELYLAALENLF